MPRPRKSKSEVRAARQRAANTRWSALSADKRRIALQPAIAASPANKPREASPAS